MYLFVEALRVGPASKVVGFYQSMLIIAVILGIVVLKERERIVKKVAGSLKLDLAQYRELEAFAQFGSDLDESTKKQLERGKRAVEVLKQLQYSPMKIENQIVTLYALTKGLMDDVSIDKIKEFEQGLIEYSERHAKTFYKEIKESKMWTDKGEVELKKVIGDFKMGFSK